MYGESGAVGGGLVSKKDNLDGKKEGEIDYTEATGEEGLRVTNAGKLALGNPTNQQPEEEARPTETQVCDQEKGWDDQTAQGGGQEAYQNRRPVQNGRRELEEEWKKVPYFWT
ncbi:hypothetical protein NDU88_008118 [Pleurodeles waltl]|uniref:Uncharacterized protein n=1 Tax=Pleurodeles waltl TaxID=8319 RepID=A0AAV7NYA4_PLEWA|nr:hypothetical protein NDU88_008118 [Pleurodeles waltl]